MGVITKLKESAMKMLQDNFATQAMLADFIKELCHTKSTVYIFLMSGIKLHGYIVDHDDASILLGGKALQLVYKHSISTIMTEQQALAATSNIHPVKAHKITEKDIKAVSST